MSNSSSPLLRTSVGRYLLTDWVSRVNNDEIQMVLSISMQPDLEPKVKPGLTGGPKYTIAISSPPFLGEREWRRYMVLKDPEREECELA